MSKAARLASIDRTTLYRLMDKHGLAKRGERRGTWSDVRTPLPPHRRGARRRRAAQRRAGRVGPGGSAVPLAPPLGEALRQAVLETEAESRRRAAARRSAEDGAAARGISATPCARSRERGEAAAAAPRPRARSSRLLRRQLIGDVSRAGQRRSTPRQLLAALRRVEQVATRLEPDWSQHFADRLSGPDGLELVVEVAHDLRSPAHLDPLPRRDAAAGPQRPAHPAAGAPARASSTARRSASARWRAT